MVCLWKSEDTVREPALLPWRSYGSNCGGQSGDKRLYPRAISPPCFYFSRQGLGSVAKARLQLSTLPPPLFARQEGRSIVPGPLSFV